MVCHKYRSIFHSHDRIYFITLFIEQFLCKIQMAESQQNLLSYRPVVRKGLWRRIQDVIIMELVVHGESTP